MAAIHEMCIEIAELRRKCEEREAACAELRAQVATLTEQARDDVRDLEALDTENDRLGRDLVEARKYDARKLLRCPECGSESWWVRDRSSHRAERYAIECAGCDHVGPESPTTLAALLAWHKVTP